MAGNVAADSKGPIKGIVSLIVIILAVVFIFWYFKGGDNPAVARDLKVLAIDIETREVVQAVQKVGETFPLTNSAGKKTLWAAYACQNEQILFPATPKTMVMVCPHCGDQRVGSVSINGEEAKWRVKMPDKLPEIPQ